MAHYFIPPLTPEDVVVVDNVFEHRGLHQFGSPDHAYVEGRLRIRVPVDVDIRDLKKDKRALLELLIDSAIEQLEIIAE